MKEHEEKELERLEALRKTIEKSPLTKQIIAQEAAEVLKTRREAAGKIEVLKKAQADSLPKLQAVEEEKEAKYLKAKAALRAASDEFQAAHLALSSENNNFDTDIRNLESILFESADPQIEAAITFFRGKLDDLRKPGRISSRGMNVKRNMFTDTKTLTTETNADAVHAAILFCRGAIEALEMLKLSPALDLQKIEEIKKRIPDIEVYTESTGEKPLEGSRGINPRHLLKSDSQMDWEIGKLNEKFKKLMGR